MTDILRMREALKEVLELHIRRAFRVAKSAKKNVYVFMGEKKFWNNLINGTLEGVHVQENHEGDTGVFNNVFDDYFDDVLKIAKLSPYLAAHRDSLGSFVQPHSDAQHVQIKVNIIPDGDVHEIVERLLLRLFHIAERVKMMMKQRIYLTDRKNYFTQKGYLQVRDHIKFVTRGEYHLVTNLHIANNLSDKDILNLLNNNPRLSKNDIGVYI